MNEQINRLLAECRTIAVVGLSNRAERDSYQVARYLQAAGYRIVAVNPMYAGTRILGEYCYSNLTEAAEALAACGVAIDMVDCFRLPHLILPIAQEAIQLPIKCLWMQLGIVNQDAADLARRAGIAVVMDRCTKIDHRNMQRSCAD